MAAYLLYYYTLRSEWIVTTNAHVLHNAIIKFYNNEMYTCLPPLLTSEWIVMTITRVFHNNETHNNKL